MHEPINVKSPNNTNKWQIGFNSSFKELTGLISRKRGRGNDVRCKTAAFLLLLKCIKGR
jgi:hypothetical protein